MILEWTYTPDGYFEDSFQITDELYEVNISQGKIEARIDPVHYDAEDKIREKLHKKIESIFLARQLYIHQSYALSKSTMYRLYSDGRRDATVFIEGVQAVCSVGIVDVMIGDSDGNVISNTRQERIDTSNAFVELIVKYEHDPLLLYLLGSYNASVEYPENELVYLYDIRDALAAKFSGEKNIIDILNITKSDWSNLGRLANDEPIIQGRHRGKKAPDLRSATSEELEEVRTISKKFIEAYLNYLESQKV